MPRTKEEPINKYQIKKIHTLKGVLAMADETYRAALFEAFGVTTSKDLNSAQAAGMIRYFEKEAISANAWTRVDPEEKYQKLKGRPDHASPKQLAFIEDLWRQVSRAKAEARAKALRSFLGRQVGVSDLRFLKSVDAGKVINALKSMKQQAGGK